jgi:hypothetical protein
MDSMIDKIRKLMALAGSNPNVHEAAAAAEMAASLAAKYNIDMDAVRLRSEKSFIESETGGFSFSRRDEMGALQMAMWTCRLFGCTVWYRTFNSCRKAVISGQPHNVALAESWLEFLWNSCKRANREHAHAMSYPTFGEREKARQSFRLAFCSAVAKRLMEKVDSMKKQGVSGSTALVVTAWFDEEQREVAEFVAKKHPEMGNFKVRRPTTYERRAAEAGSDAGNRVSLAHQIGGSAQAKQIG